MPQQDNEESPPWEDLQEDDSNRSLVDKIKSGQEDFTFGPGSPNPTQEDLGTYVGGRYSPAGGFAVEKGVALAPSDYYSFTPEQRLSLGIMDIAPESQKGKIERYYGGAGSSPSGKQESDSPPWEDFQTGNVTEQTIDTPPWEDFKNLPTKRAIPTGGIHEPSPPTFLENLPPEEDRLVGIIEKHRIEAAKQGIYPKAVRATEADKFREQTENYLRKVHSTNNEEIVTTPWGGGTNLEVPGINEPLYQPKRLEAGQQVPDVDPATGQAKGTVHEASAFEAAATNTVNGVLSGATSVKGLLEMLPPVFLAETLYNAPTLWRNIQEAEKTPAWSQERWEVGLSVAGTLATLGLMGDSMVKGLMKAAPKEVADRITQQPTTEGVPHAKEPDTKTSKILTQQGVAPISQAEGEVQAGDPRDASAKEQEKPVAGIQEGMRVQVLGEKSDKPYGYGEVHKVTGGGPQGDKAQIFVRGKMLAVDPSRLRTESGEKIGTPPADEPAGLPRTIMADPTAADRAQVLGNEEAVRQAAMSKAIGLESPSAQALGITPFDPFAKDLAQKTRQVAGTFAKAAKQIRVMFSPANASPEAKTTAEIIRAQEGLKAREHEKAVAAVKDTMKIFNRTSNAHNLDVIDKMEKGQPIDPRFDPYRVERKRAYDQRIAEVQKLNPYALQNLIEDYFPHIWTKESIARVQGNLANVPASNPWAAMFGKRPLTGPKSFLKQRTIPDTMSGVAIGLEPASFNPVELDLLKWHEMDRYIAGQKILQEMKDAGLTKFARTRPPPGYTAINDPIARVFLPKDFKIIDPQGREVPGQKLAGHLYAPDDVARVINNHLSPGLRGKALYDALRYSGNLMNQVQLGLSLYHATFTAIDAAASTMSLGIEQIARSGGSPADIAKGTFNIARSLAQTPVGTLVENLWRGSKFLKEYSKPGSTNARMGQIVDALVQGGTRVKMDTFYKTGAVDSFFKAFREGNYGGALLRLPLMAIEAAAKPLMEHVVPRLKLGISAQMMDYELGKLPVNASEAVIRRVAGRIVDTVDDRMGQMIYDNLFWNKVLKDGLMASIRSVGWNVGDIRLFGGGALDFITSPVRMAKAISAPEVGANPVMTHRMAYMIAYPFMVGTLGAIYQYMKTGKGPEEAKDYFMPKTGRMNPDGTQERVMLPTYMKDIAPLYVAGERHGAVGSVSRLATMAQHKSHPLFNMFSQMWFNKDFYGTEIRHEDDNIVQTLKKEGAFILKQFKPFSFQGLERRVGGVEPKAEAIVGVMPASHELTMSPAEELAHKYYVDSLPQGARTQEQAELSQAKKGMMEKARKGDYSDLQKAVSNGQLSQQAAMKLAKRVQMDPLTYQLQRMTPDQAMSIWRVASREERVKIGDTIRAKVLRSKTLNREKMIGYINELSQEYKPEDKEEPPPPKSRKLLKEVPGTE